ncbi:hypothetical protein BDZ89DRAFT_1058194 [Hymenopellis radicata]|nr:hypothetical protein BDZ89DRAFT_1058194 [Hymenopellis radicata]
MAPTSSTISYKDSFFSFPEDDHFSMSKSMRLTSYSRYLERRMVNAWKKVTSMTKKQHRASYLPPNFVLVTPTKRRSIRYAH